MHRTVLKLHINTNTFHKLKCITVYTNGTSD